VRERERERESMRQREYETERDAIPALNLFKQKILNNRWKRII
jgi:hypothetical protein